MQSKAVATISPSGRSNLGRKLTNFSASSDLTQGQKKTAHSPKINFSNLYGGASSRNARTGVRNSGHVHRRWQDCITVFSQFLRCSPRADSSIRVQTIELSRSTLLRHKRKTTQGEENQKTGTSPRANFPGALCSPRRKVAINFWFLAAEIRSLCPYRVSFAVRDAVFRPFPDKATCWSRGAKSTRQHVSKVTQ